MLEKWFTICFVRYLLVLLKAKQQGLVPLVKPLIEQLRQGGIWLSNALVDEALKLAGE